MSAARVGLLWCDNSTERTLATKIARAAERHEERLGTTPDVCYVPESDVPDEGEVEIDGRTVTVLGDKAILKHHLFVMRESGDDV